jgi:hypothetical protein
MRRFALPLLALLLLAAPASPRAQQAQVPPHAWLYGAWTGGMFPAPSGMTAQECLSQPTVIFTRDIVMRATLTEATYVERVVESARLTITGTEFRFQSASPVQTSGSNLLGLGPQEVPGFGCQNPDELHVLRRGPNEISFPDCADFPYPLVRCPGR